MHITNKSQYNYTISRTLNTIQ